LQKTCIIIVGPTAVGKTAFAIDLAKALGTSIVSADSRQCYREMSIGTAKPTAAELAQVPHFFVNSHSVQQDLNAIDFEQYALQAVHQIFEQQDVAVMVGGTGLYIQAFCDGLDAVPAIEPAIREKVRQGFDANGLDWLQAQMQTTDPDFMTLGEWQNPQRMMRALEVKWSTGHSILAFRSQQKANRDFRILKFGLQMERDALVKRIDTRVDAMLQQGLLQEVEALMPYQHKNALQTVGYKEIFELLDGAISLEKAVEDMKIHTRQYAKRQMTWFRKDTAVQWLNAAALPQTDHFLQNFL
jgi:tRNA dimethylallyltransferase